MSLLILTWTGKYPWLRFSCQIFLVMTRTLNDWPLEYISAPSLNRPTSSISTNPRGAASVLAHQTEGVKKGRNRRNQRNDLPSPHATPSLTSRLPTHPIVYLTGSRQPSQLSDGRP